jgi:hypothetical protein
MSSTPHLTGTLPVRAHGQRFYGTLQADGQQARVAGLACDEGELVTVSLVGYETSVAAILASLWVRREVPFLVAQGVQWEGPRTMKRRGESYREISTPLPSTRESHYLALPVSVHILEGILHPVDLPTEEEETPATPFQPFPPLSPEEQKARRRFVLGNWDEETPHPRSFLGHLYGMRLPFLHRDLDHPEWSSIWADALWKRGMARRLVVPLPHTLGLRAWRLSGDLAAWIRLLSDGVREGWLPWKKTTLEPLSLPRRERPALRA